MSSQSVSFVIALLFYLVVGKHVPGTKVHHSREMPDFIEQHYKHLEMFDDFISKYERNYRTEEEYYKRFLIFHENMKEIDRLNAEDTGTAIYVVTEFSDITPEEFRAIHPSGMFLEDNAPQNFEEAEIPDVDLPESIDWRTKGVVTSVKNQGSCGSCWAFSAVGNIEGQYAIKYNKLVEFSPQQLVACLWKPNKGCRGGLPRFAFDQLNQMGGLETEADYPYDEAHWHFEPIDKCKFNKSKVAVQIKSYVNISQSETDMAKWLVKNGPISVLLDASPLVFYGGGVIHVPLEKCNNTVDHAVLIVGYGVEKNSTSGQETPYWIVKNSWGKEFGPYNGYFLIYRGDGTCQINKYASSAIIE